MNQPEIPRISRRQLLKILGLAGTAGVVGACAGEHRASNATAGARSDPVKSDASNTTVPGRPAKERAAAAKPSVADAGRVLVVVELQGGNDGLATLIPYTDDRLRRMRERIWVDPKELVMLDDRYAMAKGLGPVKDRLAFIEGVGVAKPDLSHFAMSQRWWAGDPDGTGSIATGFLGRCCDALHRGEPITGVSVGSGSNPSMIAATASTVSLPQLDLVRDIAKTEPAEKRLRRALAGVAGSDGAKAALGIGDETDRLTGLARQGLGSGLELLDTLTRIGERPKRYPEANDLASAFALTRQLVSLDTGMRVFHIPWGSFDTHSNEVGDHGSQMEQFGVALAAFLDDIHDHGLDDRILVATTSEFGRRPEANAGGTDHGTASVMMLSGAVKPGRHGEAPNLARLDADGNLKATVSMADYYATLAAWLGVSPADTIANGAPITGVFV